MTVDLFANVLVLPTVDTRCRCGQGYCPMHGTFDFPDEVEETDWLRRQTPSCRGTNGGRRVRRKKIGGGK